MEPIPPPTTTTTTTTLISSTNFIFYFFSIIIFFINRNPALLPLVFPAKDPRAQGQHGVAFVVALVFAFWALKFGKPFGLGLGFFFCRIAFVFLLEGLKTALGYC